jgi:hypothetical protein
MSEQPDAATNAATNAETEHDHLFAREWPELLDEIRVALPAVQLLFGFLLAAPFSAHFPNEATEIRRTYFVCFLCTAASSAFLIAPTVYHRLHWRRDVRDKELMMRTCNRLAIVGVSLLAVAMTTAVYVVARVVSDRAVAAVTTVAAGLTFLGLWFGLPLLRRRRDLSARRDRPT